MSAFFVPGIILGSGVIEQYSSWEFSFYKQETRKLVNKQISPGYEKGYEWNEQSFKIESREEPDN